MNADGSKRWIRIASKAVGIVCSGVLIGIAGIFLMTCLFGITMTACSYADASTQRHFDSFFVGATKESVIANMGTPSHVETPDSLYRLIYTDKKCQGACVERLWYEHRICLDEAWAVEIDKHDKVIAKFHISSP